MALLQCRHCGSEIDSDTRRSQCRECRALFPFACAVCERNLRSPFPIYDDERHLTNSEPPLPLCEEHFLRKCPGCSNWFPNDENPGFFRCGSCAEKLQNAQPDESDVSSHEPDSEPEHAKIGGAPAMAGGQLNPNALVLGAAGCAFLMLLGWLILGR